MAKLILKLKIDPVWLYESADSSLCNGCENNIQGRMLRLWIAATPNGIKGYMKQTSIVLCENCYSVLNNTK